MHMIYIYFKTDKAGSQGQVQFKTSLVYHSSNFLKGMNLRFMVDRNFNTEPVTVEVDSYESPGSRRGRGGVTPEISHIDSLPTFHP